MTKYIAGRRAAKGAATAEHAKIESAKDSSFGVFHGRKRE